jgi:FkbM family methyltransferase
MDWMRRLARRWLPIRAVHFYRMARHVYIAPFERELDALPRLVPTGTVVFDVGANVGLYSTVLSRFSRRVLAIEPNPDCAQMLRRLRIQRVEVIEAAAAESEGQATLVVPGIHHGRGSLSPTTIDNESDIAANSHSVVTRSLDEIAATFLDHEERVGFVKIDVEGFELTVLRGAKKFLEAHRPRLMVEIEYRHGADVPAVFGFLADLGYSAFILDAAGEFTAVDPDGLAALQSAGLSGQTAYVNNVVFVPAERPL